nr:glycine dehydrogenase (aminomethyl-transferring) [Acidimicrobiia bacterium]
MATLSELSDDRFERRHIGPDDDDVAAMLKLVEHPSLEALSAAAVPAAIADEALDALPPAASEAEVLAELRGLAGRNEVAVPMIGLGYHACVTPPVILRNVLENPAWYTAYTPYQPEISQGRLEVLLRFQTMVEDLTGLPVANASMLDEGTAAAEAMTLARRASKASPDAVFVVDAAALPQTIDVVRTRAEPLGLPVVVADLAGGGGGALPEGEVFGVVVQYPGASGQVWDPSAVLAAARERGAIGVVAADLLALCLLRSPAELGADVACGTTQRFGVPIGFGGPHAGYLAVRSGLERSLPGRLVGVSVDADGAPATRLALQTREQHIRREKATSNICTAQVLLAVMAALYTQYHGPDGLRRIAGRTHRLAALLADGLRGAGVAVVHDAFFDTVLARVPGGAADVVARAAAAGIDIRLVDADHVGIATDETTTPAILGRVLSAFGGGVLAADADDVLPDDLRRTSPFLEHPAFSTLHSETSMLRELRRLADLDLALDRTMIPLGSCTMKLNATTEMEPVTWPEFGGLHPFTPAR